MTGADATMPPGCDERWPHRKAHRGGFNSILKKIISSLDSISPVISILGNNLAIYLKK
jgi:hypothetical protein